MYCVCSSVYGVPYTINVYRILCVVYRIPCSTYRVPRVTHHAASITLYALCITHNASGITHHVLRIMHHRARIPHHAFVYTGQGWQTSWAIIEVSPKTAAYPCKHVPCTMYCVCSSVYCVLYTIPPRQPHTHVSMHRVFCTVYHVPYSMYRVPVLCMW